MYCSRFPNANWLIIAAISLSVVIQTMFGFGREIERESSIKLSIINATADRNDSKLTFWQEKVVVYDVVAYDCCFDSAQIFSL